MSQHLLKYNPRKCFSTNYYWLIIIIIIIITIIIIIIIIIVDIAVPGDSNILQKETEKCEKYQDLAREIQRIWKSRTKVMPVVVGALGSVSKKLAGHLEQLGIKNRTRTMQKSALLGSAHILRKVLESLRSRDET